MGTALAESIGGGHDRRCRGGARRRLLRSTSHNNRALENLVLDAIRQFGALGVTLLMFAENVFPPIPSEIIMPLAGFLASSGDLNLAAVIVGGTFGSVAGATIWYYVGRLIRIDRLRVLIARHGAWLAMTPEDLDRAEAWFARRGTISVFVGRLVPIVRTLISVPAGVTRMPVARFLFYTMLGSAIWTSALAFGGWLLQQQFREIERYLGFVSWGVIGVVLLSYIARVVQLKRRTSHVPPRPMEGRVEEPSEAAHSDRGRSE